MMEKMNWRCHPWWKWFSANLPTVFEEGLSYYEALCRLRYIIGKIGEKTADNTASIDNLNTIVENLQKRIETLEQLSGVGLFKRSCIWIGDDNCLSSDEVKTPYQLQIKDRNYMSPFITIAKRGSGIVAGKETGDQYLQLLKNAIDQNPEYNLITLIIIQGSINDSPYLNSLNAEMTLLLNYIRVTFPLTEVVIVPLIGNNNFSIPDGAKWYEIMDVMMNFGINNGIRTIGNPLRLLGVNDAIEADNKFLTQRGNNLMSRTIGDNFINSLPQAYTGGQITYSGNIYSLNIFPRPFNYGLWLQLRFQNTTVLSTDIEVVINELYGIVPKITSYEIIFGNTVRNETINAIITYSSTGEWSLKLYGDNNSAGIYRANIEILL